MVIVTNVQFDERMWRAHQAKQMHALVTSKIMHCIFRSPNGTPPQVAFPTHTVLRCISPELQFPHRPHRDVSDGFWFYAVMFGRQARHPLLGQYEAGQPYMFSYEVRCVFVRISIHIASIRDASVHDVACKVDVVLGRLAIGEQVIA